MFKVGIYLAIGCLLHLLFIGQHFDFESASTWLWLFGWPLMLVLWGSALGIVIAILCLALLGARRIFS